LNELLGSERRIDMGCNMYEGVTSGDFAASDARDAKNQVRLLNERVAELEQALCGLCQMLRRDGLPPELADLHPQLEAWFEAHRQKPGCAA
jgi:hypothetical protein